MGKKKIKKVILKKPATKNKMKTVVVGKRKKPRGVQKDEERIVGYSKKRRPDGTFIPQSAYKGSKASAHMQNFDLKQSFLETFRLMGGCEELANWACYSNANQTEFYKIMARMLPRDITVGDGGIEPNNLSNMGDKELDAIIAGHNKKR